MALKRQSSASQFWVWSVFGRRSETTEPSAEDNPIFHYELRRLQWPRSVYWLGSYIRQISFVVPVILGLLAGGLVLGLSRYSFFFILPVLLICVLVTLAADVYYVLITLNRISRQIESGHWDMLRLTPLDEQQIIAAHFAVAQFRAWRFAAWEIGLRTFLSTTIIVSIVYYQIAYSLRFYGDPKSLALGVAAECVALLMFVAEPIWRMQAISAIALAVSARGSSVISAALTAFGSVVGTHIVEVTLIWSTLFTSFRIIQIIATKMPYYDITLVNLSVFAAIIITALFLVAFFRFIQRLALRRALNSAFRSR